MSTSLLYHSFGRVEYQYIDILIRTLLAGHHVCLIGRLLRQPQTETYWEEGKIADLLKS
ncbi:MAG: hypothetical protein GQ542_15485 [Desulforhopalus sp.]|nr:hypothetical protein [Desulforhopalus sp.]